MNTKEKRTTRCNLHISSSIVLRVDNYSSVNGLSRSQSVAELLSLGLDADSAGIESMAQSSQQIRKDIQSLRSLVVASIDSGDVAAVVGLRVLAGQEIEADQFSEVFVESRRIAGRLKQLKKQS